MKENLFDKVKSWTRRLNQTGRVGRELDVNAIDRSIETQIDPPQLFQLGDRMVPWEQLGQINQYRYLKENDLLPPQNGKTG